MIFGPLSDSSLTFLLGLTQILGRILLHNPLEVVVIATVVHVFFSATPLPSTQLSIICMDIEHSLTNQLLSQ